MITGKIKIDRRNFVKKTSVLATGLSGLAMFPQATHAIEKSPEDNIHQVGPKEGFSPQVGTLVSMMNWMRMVVLQSVKDITRQDLDYIHDQKSNTIGSMLLHLVATEVFFQANTFEGRKEYNESEKTKWNIPMNLGEEARKKIKGNELSYYLDVLQSTREKTVAEFRKRDDRWLMSVDPTFFNGQPTNNYCKWFHVCEHESNHNGQIKWIKGRISGAKPGRD